MSEAGTLGVVLSHGSLAAGLVDAVRQITGSGADHLIAVSNRGLSPEGLMAELRRVIGERPTVLFTDLPSGSCSLAARRLSAEISQLVVVSGANLPLLLDFVIHRELPLAALGPRLVERGRAAISVVMARS